MEHLEHWTGHRPLLAGLWLVLFAVAARLAMALPIGTLAAEPQPSGRILSILTEVLTPQGVREETASQKFSKRERPPRTEKPEPEVMPLSFEPTEADAIAIGGNADYSVDSASLLTTPLKLDKTDGPTVLIVHTHTSEAYTPTPDASYEATDPYRTADPEHNMLRVGAEVARVLEEQGIETVQDLAVNDAPEYIGAYERSFDRIEAQLAEHPSIQVVLDIHRDAVENAEGEALRTSADIGGEACAQLMLVVGTDQGGLTHPNWQENLSFALKLQTLIERENPGICRHLSLRRERFNQHFTPCSLLVEVGSTGDTQEEALAAARRFASSLAELIRASQ